MLKPLTLSLSLAVALGLSSVSMAGGHDNNCTTCGLASPQGVVASPQGNYGGGCEQACKPPRQSCLKNLFHHEVCYEWVLKKKHVWHRGGSGGCNTCGGGGAAPVYATGQVAPSGQYAAPSGQYAAPTSQYGGASGQYGAPVYGAGQRSAFLPARGATTIASAPAEMTPAPVGGEEVPPAPAVGGTGSRGGLLLPGPSGN